MILDFRLNLKVFFGFQFVKIFIKRIRGQFGLNLWYKNEEDIYYLEDDRKGYWFGTWSYDFLYFFYMFIQFLLLRKFIEMLVKCCLNYWKDQEEVKGWKKKRLKKDIGY